MLQQEITLLDAFEALQSKETFIDCDFCAADVAEIRYLTERLQLTEVQVLVLAVFFRNKFCGMKPEQISEALGWSSVGILRNERQIDDLVKRRYICKEPNFHKEVVLNLSKAAREAIRNDKPLDNNTMQEEKRFSDMQLIERFETIDEHLRSSDDTLIMARENLPEHIMQQIDAIQTATGWNINEILFFSKLFSNNDSGSSKLFNYQEKRYFQSAIKALLKKRYICSISERGDNFRIMPTILEQLTNGQQLEFPFNFADNEDLFEALSQQFHLRDSSDGLGRGVERIFSETLDDLRKIINLNQHLTFCSTISNLNFDRFEFFTLVYMCHHFINEYSDEICIRSIKVMIGENENGVNRFIISLMKGESPLITDGWIEYKGKDFRGEKFGLTRKSQTTLLGDIKLVKSSIVNAKELKQPDSFAAKTLVYNERERGEVERLADLLKPDNFARVKQRLADNGERKGFVCLFYGAPGTGKTETVQQIARQTGRSLYQINISEINSCWVGESEKNIKRIFDRYRDFAENCTPEPILFFNEADGIFTKRVDTGGANPTVAQMQNAVQNIILQEMETLEGIMIATTNLTQNLDSAMERRILFKIKFDKPETDVKAQIWRTFLPSLTDEQAKSLALRYDFSGGQIENIKRKSVVDNILSGIEPDFDTICDYCSREKLDCGRTRIGFSINNLTINN